MSRAVVHHYKSNIQDLVTLNRPRRDAIGRNIPPISTEEYRWVMVICAVAGVCLLGVIALLLAGVLTTTTREKQN